MKNSPWFLKATQTVKSMAPQDEFADPSRRFNGVRALPQAKVEMPIREVVIMANEIRMATLRKFMHHKPSEETASLIRGFIALELETRLHGTNYNPLPFVAFYKEPNIYVGIGQHMIDAIKRMTDI